MDTNLGYKSNFEQARPRWFLFSASKLPSLDHGQDRLILDLQELACGAEILFLAHTMKLVAGLVSCWLT